MKIKQLTKLWLNFYGKKTKMYSVLKWNTVGLHFRLNEVRKVWYTQSEKETVLKHGFFQSRAVQKTVASN